MGYDLEGLRRALRANAKKRGKRGRSKAPTISRGLTGPQIRAAGKAVKRAEASAAQAEAILLKGSKRKSSRKKTSHKKTSKRKTSRRPSSKRRSSRKKSSRKKSSKRRGSKKRGSKRRGSKRRTTKKAGSKRGRGRKRRTSKRRGGSHRGWSAAAATGRTVAYPLGGGMFHRQSMSYTAGTGGPRGAIRKNFLASKGPGSSDLIQVVRREKGGYPSYVSGFVAPRTIQRKFTLGGAAKRAHAAGSGWRSELRRLLSGPKKTSRKKSSRRRGSKRASAPKKNSNRRHHMARKRRTRRNPKYAIVGNKRHGRRRVRRNALMVYGKDLLKDVAIPGGVATGGFMAANALANAAANMDSIRNVLDAGKTPDQALLTKSLANGLGIIAAMGAAQWMRGNSMVSDNATPALTGMGLSLVARLLRGVSAVSPYLGRFGEYVEQPMGEYVEQPMGAYVNDPSHGIGEYVEQPMSGLGTTYYAAAGLGGATMYATAGYAEGIDPANQDGVDGLMDVMEAAAGTPAQQAAAGMGAGDAPDGSLAARAASSGGYTTGLQQPPFVSQQTPTDMARAVTKQFPYDRPIETSLVTPEGRGYAGGLFARNLFAGMF